MESVVVAESGDESDDDWNYVPVNKNGDEKPETATSTEHIVSPSPPTVSIGEPEELEELHAEHQEKHEHEHVDQVEPEESHALSQAIVESEEHCAEVRKNTK